jgi:hypothetical protein
MSILSNKNSTQQPLQVAGRTGTQTLRFIPGPRVYVKAADPQSSTPVQSFFTKSNGVTPTGWTDLGIIEGDLKVTYDNKLKEVRTGIDNVLRAVYSEQKTAQIECSLAQLDDIVLETITGTTASVIVPGSIVNYQLGTTDVINLAVLFVLQSKLDSKEIQFYNPFAYVSFSIDKSGDALVAKMSGTLPPFTAVGATKESFLSTTLFA